MSNFATLKKIFIKVLIGSLIGSAIVAVIAVLIGQFSDIVGRALFTLALVALHSVISLAYIQSNEQSEETQGLVHFSNSVFLIIILSFITSISGVWNVIDSNLVDKLYQSYFVLLFGILHAELLFKSMNLEIRIDRIVKANFVFIALVVTQILLVICFNYGGFNDAYYRVLSAAAIVDATLTILAVILQKLYLSRHPEVMRRLFSGTGTVVNSVDGSPALAKRPMNPILVAVVTIVSIFIGLQFLVGLLFLGGSGLFFH